MFCPIDYAAFSNNLFEKQSQRFDYVVCNSILQA